ncbi:MAG: molybdopterin-dependent oxidoreductase [Proteobacteria bacterium]|nr:molybdopterin-dependent oxidoreductase [Pseudomonadota bacterium]MCP4920436.1 molybdopterin-dependent oxidoreductase [Pseudomonadota bacterium]
MTNSIPEIRDTELMFVIGSNTTEAHPIIAMEMKRAKKNGSKLIVADPRRIWLADIADLYLPLKPGTDVALLTAMAHVIITEGLHDTDFIAKHCEDFQAVVDATRDTTPEWAETITDVPAEDIRAAARMYATTDKAGIYYTLGITEHTHGTDNVHSLANLVLMTGHLGKRSMGLNPLRGQNNVQGANDAGASPVFYPGYQRVSDAAAREKFAEAWDAELSPDDGMNLNVMMKNLGTKLKGLYIMGEDVILSEPNTTKIEEGMNRLEFVVCQDIFLNETSRFADVVLPAACFAEKDGVFTNSDRRVQRVRAAVSPPGQARADWQILVDVARACGYDMPDYAGPDEVYAEMASLSPKFAGISHERIEDAGLQWPCPDPEHPGTPTLHGDGPIRGRGIFQAAAYRPSDELPDNDYPLLLSTGRTLYHYNSATQTRRASGPDAKQPDNFVEMHRLDAKMRGVAAGELVRVTSRRGTVLARVFVSPRMRKGCVWMPLHFAEQNTNRLTNDAGDPITQTAEYKVCAVKVQRLEAAK